MGQNSYEKIYELAINGIRLNNNNLFSCGYTEEDIKYFISKRIIAVTEDGNYEIFSADKFHQYGIKLLVNGNVRDANKCFRMCYRINPTGRRINIQMLLAAIKRNDYVEGLKFYSNLENNSSEKHILDNNLYLYLLNLVTDLPVEYKEKVRDFKYEDLVFTDAVCNKDENTIRVAVYNNKFLYACKLLNDLLKKKADEYSVKYQLLRALISKTVDEEKKFKNNLLALAKNEEYDEIVKIITERSNKKKLGRLETYVLLVAYAIVNLLKSKTIPEASVDVTYDMYAAIMGNNFELALELNEEHHILTESSKEDDPVNILLVKINEIIKEMKMKGDVVKHQNILQAELDRHIMDSEALAYYIKSENISLEDASKKFGITKETMMMIKLVYIRDYYVEGKVEEADKLLEEIEGKETLTPLIRQFINKIRSYKEIKTEIKVRKRIKENNEGEN